MLPTSALYHESDMDSTRISVARVLELGVQVTWREAAAIVHEAVALTGPTKGPRPSRVGAESCVITRGGEVLLLNDADQARPETMVQLLQDLLAACDSPGGLAGALANGTALSFLEDLSLQVTYKRRRVEIAGVALRALAAEADRRRAESERAAGGGVHQVDADLDDDLDLPVEVPADVPFDLMPHPEPVARRAGIAVAEEASAGRDVMFHERGGRPAPAVAAGRSTHLHPGQSTDEVSPARRGVGSGHRAAR